MFNKNIKLNLKFTKLKETISYINKFVTILHILKVLITFPVIYEHFFCHK